MPGAYMWFAFSIIALLCWSCSDLFSKIGCSGEKDKYSHLKMVIAVGLVMGLHAAYEIFINGVEVNREVITAYLPVSFLYISSMALGYLAMRYIELSISSPVCNSSGAIVAVLTIATRGLKSTGTVSLLAVALVCAGVIALGITEATEDEELRELRQSESGRKYARSAVAIAIPVIYCLLDALGTFADSIILENLDESSANCAYELTFLAVGFVCAVYVFIVKRQKVSAKEEIPKYIAACFETAGQFFYIYALADTDHVAYTVPIVSGYCAASVLWSRIFLKEKLSKKHYISIALVVCGIIILGVLDI